MVPVASQGKWPLCVQLNTARKTKFKSLYFNRYKKHLQSLQFPSFLKRPKVYVPAKCVKNLFYLLHLHISRDPAGMLGGMSCYALNVIQPITEEIGIALSQGSFASILFSSL